MTDAKQTRRRIQKNLQNSFSWKKNTIIRKRDALYRLDNDTDAYFVLRNRVKLYTYTSSETESWPPTATQIICRFIKLQVVNTDDF